MGILLDGEEYQAQQFHFHFGSEHRIDSRQFPLEMHIVHKSARGKLAVVAVLFKIASRTGLIYTFDINYYLRTNSDVYNLYKVEGLGLLGGKWVAHISKPIKFASKPEQPEPSSSIS